MSFLGNVTVQEFFNNYWEKKPLLIKNSYSEANNLTTAQELKELAYDADFESRIVYNILDENLKGSVILKHGPLIEKDFSGDQWTFMAHNLNLLDPSFYKLQQETQHQSFQAFSDPSVLNQLFYHPTV